MARDPLTEAIDHQISVLETVLGELGTAVWRFRVEVGWIVVIALLYGVAFLALGHAPIAAGVYVLLLLAILARTGRRAHPRHRIVRRSLDGARIRRRWNRAVEHCGLAHSVPISKIRRSEGGYRATIRVGWGISLRDLQMQKERLAASMGIGDLWIDRDPENAATGTALLTIVVPNDYLAGASKAEWPVAAHLRRRR